MRNKIYIFVLLLAIAASMAACKSSPSAQATASPTLAQTATTAPTGPSGPPSPITGLPYSGKYYPIAVMIEDSPEARPQYGLGEADIVYEAYAEGGITRFMAIFNTNYPKMVGPVRSARSYYVSLQQEWDCMYLHFGGSPVAKKMLSDLDVKYNMDGIRGVKGVKRNSSFPAPHNVFADLTVVKQKYLQAPSTVRQFQFGTVSGTPATKVVVPFNSSFAHVEYTYDTSTNKYLRANKGKPTIDAATGTQIAVTNVIVMRAQYYVEDTHKGRQGITLISSGKATLYTGGQAVQLTWERKDLKSPTVFRDSTGKEMTLQKGTTWIEIVRPSTKVTAS